MFGDGMNDAMGSKNTCVKLFQLSFSTGGSSRKGRGFRMDEPVGILSRKTLSRKSPFSTVYESLIWASVINGRFRLTNPTVYQLA